MRFDSEGSQYKEEEAKGLIYRKDASADGCTVDELWKAEAFLHGRTRMALLDLNNNNDISINHKRLEIICNIRKIWIEANKDSTERRKLIATIIMAMPYDYDEEKGDKTKTFFNLYTDNDAIMKLLASKYDKYIQHSLLDCIIKNGIDVSPEVVRNENPANFQNHFKGNLPKWIRDWQENLLWLLGNKPKDTWGLTVKKRDIFYLSRYGGALSTNGVGAGAIPINDYRFDYYKDPSSPQWAKFCKWYCNSDTSVTITGKINTTKKIREEKGVWWIQVDFIPSAAEIITGYCQNHTTKLFDQIIWRSEQDFFEQICNKIDEAELALKEDH